MYTYIANGLLREEALEQNLPPALSPGFSIPLSQEREKSHAEPALAKGVIPESSSPLTINACGVNNWASWISDHRKHQGRWGVGTVSYSSGVIAQLP